MTKRFLLLWILLIIEMTFGLNSMRRYLKMEFSQSSWDYLGSNANEPMYSISYDPLEPPSQSTIIRDLEDHLMKRSLRFFDKQLLGKHEVCYLIGLEDKSLSRTNQSSYLSMEESLSELSELAGAAGLLVAGSSYQRVAEPNIQYYIGQGKTKEIVKAMQKLKCTCAIFDTELTPSQQKNLEIILNESTDGKANKEKKNRIKVIDRTALILDIFAQHARTKEGQLQVQLALLTYRLPRLTNLWTHLERQTAGAKGRSNGGVGLRGPGEKQIESDRREMKKKISVLKKAIDSVRRHRSMQRNRRRRLGLPVVALVGYTNAGKSTVLNALTNAGVYVADQLFATLDPTTRIVSFPGIRHSNILLTDTVGFISKLPTNLVAAFRATLEEIAEADVLLHVVDVSNPAWKKQEASVLQELHDMGLAHKPVVTVWNKIDLVPKIKEQYKFLASKLKQTIAMSAVSGEGVENLASVLEEALSSQLEEVTFILPYQHSNLLNLIHSLGFLASVQYIDDGIEIVGKLPTFLCKQIRILLDSDGANEESSFSETEIRSDWFDELEKQISAETEDEDMNNDAEDCWDPSKLIETEDY